MIHNDEYCNAIDKLLIDAMQWWLAAWRWSECYSPPAILARCDWLEGGVQTLPDSGMTAVASSAFARKSTAPTLDHQHQHFRMYRRGITLTLTMG